MIDVGLRVRDDNAKAAVLRIELGIGVYHDLAAMGSRQAPIQMRKTWKQDIQERLQMIPRRRPSGCRLGLTPYGRLDGSPACVNIIQCGLHERKWVPHERSTSCWYVSASCNARAACGTRVLRVRALVCVGVIHREDCMCANEYGKYGWWHVLASYSARAA